MNIHSILFIAWHVSVNVDYFVDFRKETSMAEIYYYLRIFQILHFVFS